MKYRRILKEIAVNLCDITIFELPETVTHIRVLPSDKKESVFVTALETFGNAVTPMKKFKLICLTDDCVVEHTVDYEPKTMYYGDVTIKSKVKGDKIYSCYGLS